MNPIEGLLFFLSKALGLFIVVTVGMAGVYLIVYTIGYALLH